MRRVLTLAQQHQHHHLLSATTTVVVSRTSPRFCAGTTMFGQPLTTSTCTFLNQQQAIALDEELMRTFSTDQLMELAGLSVAQAMHEHYRGTGGLSGGPSAARCFGHGTDIDRVVVVCGSGNNGGDGLVVARHLAQFQFAEEVVVVYPKLASVSKPLYASLLAQLAMCRVPVQAELPEDIARAAGVLRNKDLTKEGGSSFDDDKLLQKVERTLVVDAVFGYSFSGDVREPYRAILTTLNDAQCRCVSVDIPSGWHVETGLNGLPEGACTLRAPEVLVSLMLPKQGVSSIMQLPLRRADGDDATPMTAHYLGGRFVPLGFQETHNLTIPAFPGHQQYVLL